MRRYGSVVVAFGVLLSLCITGCRPGFTLSAETMPVNGDKFIARSGNGAEWTASYFFNIINETTLLMPGGTMGAERSAYLIDSLLIDTLAGFEADQVDVRDYYYEYSQIKQAYHDLILETYWNKTLYEKTTSDSLEALQFYKENQHLFSAEEQVDMFHILASPTTIRLGPDSAQLKQLSRVELFDLAKRYIDNVAQLLDWGEPFENVAYNYSHDASSREHGGYVGWTKREQYLDPFDSVAFSLEPGEYSKPYSDKDGWHIIKVGAYLPAGPLPIDSPQVFESARLTLMTAKSNAELEARLDSLRGEINYVANEAILDTNIHLVHDTVWAAILNGMDTIDSRYLSQFEYGIRATYDVDNSNREQKHEMIRAAFGRFIQLQAARQAGIDTLPEVETKWKAAVHAKAKNLAWRNAYDPTWQPEDSIVRAYYDAHLDDYVFEKPLRIEYVTAYDSAFADFLRDQAESGLDISEVVRENGGEGDLRVDYTPPADVGPDDLEDNLYKLALRTPAGSVSDVTITPEGSFRFVKVLQRRESRYYDIAKGDIRTILIRAHGREVWNEFRDKLYSKYGIKFDRNVSLIVLGNYHERRSES